MKFRFPVALAAIAPLEAHDAPVVEHAASSPDLPTTTVNAPEDSPWLFILLKIENHVSDFRTKITNASDIQNMEKSI